LTLSLSMHAAFPGIFLRKKASPVLKTGLDDHIVGEFLMKFGKSVFMSICKLNNQAYTKASEISFLWVSQ
jgi:hypothetical protein